MRLGLALIVAGLLMLGFSEYAYASTGSTSSSSSSTNTTSTAHGGSTTTTTTQGVTITKTQPTMTLSCVPGIVYSNGSSTCTVVLSGTHSNPSGTVSFSGISNGSCQLSGSTCSINVTGGGSLTADYAGDAYDLPQSVSFNIQTYQVVPITVTGDSSGTVGVPVSLGASGCAGCTYTWNFDDGGSYNSGDLGSVTHVWSAPGSYTVTVTGQGGTLVGSPGTFTVSIAAAITQSGQIPLVVIVDQSSTNAPVFGAQVTVDGQTQTFGSNGYVLFLLPQGTYTVTATATGFEQGGQTVQVTGDGNTIYLYLNANGCGVPGQTCPQSITSGNFLGLGLSVAQVLAVLGAGLFVSGLVVESKGVEV